MDPTSPGRPIEVYTDSGVLVMPAEWSLSTDNEGAMPAVAPLKILSNCRCAGGISELKVGAEFMQSAWPGNMRLSVASQIPCIMTSSIESRCGDKYVIPPGGGPMAPGDLSAIRLSLLVR